MFEQSVYALDQFPRTPPTLILTPENIAQFPPLYLANWFMGLPLLLSLELGLQGPL